MKLYDSLIEDLRKAYEKEGHRSCEVCHRELPEKKEERPSYPISKDAVREDLLDRKKEERACCIKCRGIRHETKPLKAFDVCMDTSCPCHKKPTCCDKCNPVIPGVMKWQMGFCNNQDCECHTERASLNEVQLEIKVKDGVGYVFAKEPRVEEWAQDIFVIARGLSTPQKNQLIDYITRLLLSERSRLKGVVESKRKVCLHNHSMHDGRAPSCKTIDIQNEVLDDIIKAI